MIETDLSAALEGVYQLECVHETLAGSLLPNRQKDKFLSLFVFVKFVA